MRPAGCHPDRPHSARGLCKPCYMRAWWQGEHTRHALTAAPQGRPRTSDEVLEEVAFLRGRCPCDCHNGSRRHLGMACSCPTPRELAPRLGMKPDALRKALWRARRRAVAA